jgi:hypothetical protein
MEAAPLGGFFFASLQGRNQQEEISNWEPDAEARRSEEGRDARVPLSVSGGSLGRGVFS